jgi:hypothetical protein
MAGGLLFLGNWWMWGVVNFFHIILHCSPHIQQFPKEKRGDGERSQQEMEREDRV